VICAMCDLVGGDKFHGTVWYNAVIPICLHSDFAKAERIKKCFFSIK
jgi:hypothetical protein